MKTALMFVLVLAAACGSKPASTTTTTPMPETKSEQHAMAPEVTKFHDVLSPRWHAAKGDQRMKDTCGAMADFQTNAEALAKATPANADAGKWTTTTKELSDAVAALDMTCKGQDAAAFEPAFERVHNGFHSVLETSGGGKHMEGAHHAAEHADHKM